MDVTGSEEQDSELAESAKGDFTSDSFAGLLTLTLAHVGSADETKSKRASVIGLGVVMKLLFVGVVLRRRSPVKPLQTKRPDITSELSSLM